jgi:succinyl-CoA synthetase beta subunit
MNFYEIEGKKLLNEAGILADVGVLFDEHTDVNTIQFPCVVKAQALSGKRGKAGGIKFAKNANELSEHYDFIKKMEINGIPVKAVLATPMRSIKKEYYLGYTIDCTQECIVMLFSPNGGMDIEEVAKETPEQLLKLPIGAAFDEAELLVKLRGFSLPEGKNRQICDIAAKLYNLFVRLDAVTIEINPLAELEDGALMALDAKVVLDDNALYRQGDYVLIDRFEQVSQAQKKAIECDLIYVELERGGNIGVIAGGAGIGMATVDAIRSFGGKPFNFLDLGGGVSRDKTYQAARILLDHDEVDAILINVFGGINNCLTMADGICAAILDSKKEKLVVVKSRGFSQEEGWALYDQMGLAQIRYGTTDDAVKLLLALMSERGIRI